MISLIRVQVYEPKKNTWRPIADLSAKRWKCGLVTLGGYLYAVGGMDSPRAGFWGAPLSTGILAGWIARGPASGADNSAQVYWRDG